MNLFGIGLILNVLQGYFGLNEKYLKGWIGMLKISFFFIFCVAIDGKFDFFCVMKFMKICIRTSPILIS